MKRPHGVLLSCVVRAGVWSLGGTTGSCSKMQTLPKLNWSQTQVCNIKTKNERNKEVVCSWYFNADMLNYFVLIEAKKKKKDLINKQIIISIYNCQLDQSKVDRTGI